MIIRLVALGVLSTTIASNAILVAQLATDTDEKSLSEILNPQYLGDAQAYEFILDLEDAPRLKLRPQPLMRYTSQDRGFRSGDTYIWTHNDRPVVIGTIGSYPSGTDRTIYHELHWLSMSPLQNTRVAQTYRWSPQHGIQFRTIENGPRPAQTAVRRKVQMRNLAGRFRAYVRRGTSDEPMRLLTSPLYRYGKADTDVIDGAIFAFVHSGGTDPETLLVLECREKNGIAVWYYAPARFTWRELSLTLDDKEVWRVDTYGEHLRTRDLREPFLTIPVRRINVDNSRSGQDTSSGRISERTRSDRRRKISTGPHILSLVSPRLLSRSENERRSV